jgi:hypothetical protein
MKLTANIALVAVVAASLGPGQRSPQALSPDEETALKTTLVSLERRSWEAWQKRDGSFFAGFLSDDHVEVGSRGPTNKATVIAGVASPSCVVKQYAIDTFELTAFNSETALLTYHAEQDTMCGGVPVPSPAWASSLYLKRADRWVNIAYQQTPAVRR